MKNHSPISIQRFLKPLYRFFLMDLLVDRQARPVLIYAFVLIAAGAGLFHWIEKWGWLDSVYYTVVTITTIGFGDLTPKTSLGKIVTIFYALNGIALLLMLFDQIRRIRAREYAETSGPIAAQIKKERRSGEA